jgi:hypothetical protein
LRAFCLSLPCDWDCRHAPSCLVSPLSYAATEVLARHMAAELKNVICQMSWQLGVATEHSSSQQNMGEIRAAKEKGHSNPSHFLLLLCWTMDSPWATTGCPDQNKM